MTTLSLVLTNLFRHPVRAWLTLLSLGIAFLLFTLLRTVAAWFAGDSLEGLSEDRLVVAARYSQSDQLPVNLQERILALDGVSAVTHQTWFGGIYQDPKNAFPKFVVDPRGYFDMFAGTRIEPAALDLFAGTRTGALVSEDLLEKYGWRVGDRIPIQADIWPMRDGGRLWEFELVGSYTWSDKGQSLMLLHYDYFDTGRAFAQGTVGWFTVRVEEPGKMREVAHAIDRLFENSRHPTQTTTESEYYRAFLAQAGDIGFMATGVLSAVFFTILLLGGVTMHQALRERVGELAVLKTLGFTDGWVALMLLGESTALCVFGACLGILATLVAELPLNTVLLDAGIGVFDVSGRVLAGAASLSVLLGLAVGAGPAWRASRLSIAEALRKA